MARGIYTGDTQYSTFVKRKQAFMEAWNETLQYIPSKLANSMTDRAI